MISLSNYCSYGILFYELLKKFKDNIHIADRKIKIRFKGEFDLELLIICLRIIFKFIVKFICIVWFQIFCVQKNVFIRVGWFCLKSWEKFLESLFFIYYYKLQIYYNNIQECIHLPIYIKIGLIWFPIFASHQQDATEMIPLITSIN